MAIGQLPLCHSAIANQLIALSDCQSAHSSEWQLPLSHWQFTQRLAIATPIADWQLPHSC